MTTKCESCGHEFLNVTLKSYCPRCNAPLLRRQSSQPAPADDGFDAGGFAFGIATGVPISPTHGVSTGSILGAALHQNGPAHSSPAPDPTPSPAPSYSDSSSSSSYDSGSSGGFDGGGSAAP